MRSNPISTVVILLALAICSAARAADTPKQAVGFFGTVTGKVKSARADGTSFVLTVAKPEVDAKQSTVKDSDMVGKTITLGTRMPKKDGKAAPHADDVAFIKTLKPGATVTVKVFAVRADPALLRITGPGEIAAGTDAK